MMPQTVPNRPDVGRYRADRGEERQMRLEIVDFALISRAHRSPDAVDDRARIERLLAAQLGEFAKLATRRRVPAPRSGGGH